MLDYRLYSPKWISTAFSSTPHTLTRETRNTPTPAPTLPSGERAGLENTFKWNYWLLFELKAVCCHCVPLKEVINYIKLLTVY